MLWLAVCALALGLFGLLAYWLPVSLSCNLQARAEPSGSWAVALGMGIGPIALTAIAAHELKPFLTCHLFGKQLVRLPLSGWRRRTPRKSAPSEPASPAKASLPVGFLANLDVLDTLGWWWEKKRVFEVRSLEMDVEYSFRDVALTGQILAGLCVLSGVLPDRYLLNQTPGWASEDRLALAADGRFRIWPIRLVVDVLGFVLKQRSLARRAAVPVKQVTHTP
ncbi:MAG TPA: hypothetical protein VJV79_10605 [Polyangiaceae bacterium]|nr:hypothetical protein [Polyangiaceae bacterium]